jgi:hypothetical protein
LKSLSWKDGNVPLDVGAGIGALEHHRPLEVQCRPPTGAHLEQLKAVGGAAVGGPVVSVCEA